MIKSTKTKKLSSVKKNFLNQHISNNLKGLNIIKYFSKNLTSKPGVYQMESENGEILYIGKAKNLSKRVTNYISVNNLTRRLQRMVNLTTNLNFFAWLNLLF